MKFEVLLAYASTADVVNPQVEHFRAIAWCAACRVY